MVLYEYNEDMLITSQLNYDWIADSNDWFLHGRWDYTYDADGNSSRIYTDYTLKRTDRTGTGYTNPVPAKMENDGVWQNKEDKICDEQRNLKKQVYSSYVMDDCSMNSMKLYNYHLIGALRVETPIEKELKIWPNPSDGLFFTNIDDNTEVEIYSATGTMLFKGSMDGSNNNIVLSGYPDGLYFIRFSDRFNTPITKTVIIR
jgi:hypothetical protein